MTKKELNTGNKMREVKIEKITLNIGAGKDTAKLEKGIKLIKHLTGSEPVKTTTNKRIATWGIRPGLPIGCKLTIRDTKRAKELITRILKAKNNELRPANYDGSGNVSFGIHEYIDIPGIEYNPDVGIMGFQICITLYRPGYRVKKRRLNCTKVNKSHLITKNDAVDFMAKEFGVKITE